MRQTLRLFFAGAATVALLLLVTRTEEIGRRIPFEFLTLWIGSATIVSLIFRSSPTGAESDSRDSHHRWGEELRIASIILLPLALAPMLEIRISGHDPALWLMDGALVVSLCSVPYFTHLAKTVVGGVALSVAFPSLLWVPASSAFYAKIKGAQLEGVGPTTDQWGMHAFFAPEFRHLFYTLCAMIFLLYCPIMLYLGRRRFLRT